jgi:hypothetical protein
LGSQNLTSGLWSLSGIAIADMKAIQKSFFCSLVALLRLGQPISERSSLLIFKLFEVKGERLGSSRALLMLSDQLFFHFLLRIVISPALLFTLPSASHSYGADKEVLIDELIALEVGTLGKSLFLMLGQDVNNTTNIM